MSEYLDRPPRTEEEALADIRRDQAKRFIVVLDRMIKLCQEMHETAKEMSK